MTQSNDPCLAGHLTFRSYDRRDHHAVLQLHRTGLAIGRVYPNDTAADLDIVECAYFVESKNHFWVAERHGQLVGMIGLAEMDPGVGEIMRFVVDPKYKSSRLVQLLLALALRHAGDHAYRRVVFDTNIDYEQAIAMIDHHNPVPIRTYRSDGGRALIEFHPQPAPAMDDQPFEASGVSPQVPDVK